MEQKRYCNCCGRMLRVKPGTRLVLEDYVSIEKNWGYFSDRDGVCQKMTICEQCFGQWVETFQIPPAQTKQRELL